MAAIFLPIAGAAAVGLGADVLDLVLPIGLAASLGFMLPVATPPNAIAYGTGWVTSAQMLRAGTVLDAVSILVAYVIAMALVPVIFGGGS
jgi:sodium-dependent dicarboxylate transporter 2/3/5